MRHRPLHTLILFVVLLGLFPFAMERRYPAAAPRHVQEEGRMLARATLHRLEQTPFGQTRRGKALIEEECDAFAAGLQAEAALRKMEPTFPLQLDDLSIAEFVRSQYPGIRPAPDYRPVEITREELAAMTGFNLPKKTRPLIHTNPH